MNVGQIASLDMPFGAVKRTRIDEIIGTETVLIGKYKNKTYVK